MCKSHCHEHKCGSEQYGQQVDSRNAAFFLHKLEEMIEENFEALHEEIEELEDKVIRLEKALGRR